MQVLLNVDISDFRPTERPGKSLEALVGQKLMAMGPIQAFVHDILASPPAALQESIDKGDGWVPKQQLFELFCRFAQQAGHGAVKMSPKLFINQLRLHAPAGYFVKFQRRSGRDGRKTGWLIPPLMQWRRHFEGAHACRSTP